MKPRARSDPFSQPAAALRKHVRHHWLPWLKFIAKPPVDTDNIGMASVGVTNCAQVLERAFCLAKCMCQRKQKTFLNNNLKLLGQ